MEVFVSLGYLRIAIVSVKQELRSSISMRMDEEKQIFAFLMSQHVVYVDWLWPQRKLFRYLAIRTIHSAQDMLVKTILIKT